MVASLDSVLVVDDDDAVAAAARPIELTASAHAGCSMSDMKGFKISDATPKSVDRKGKKTGADPASEPPPSVGFPRIEAEVEHDGPSLAALRARQAELAGLAKSGSPKVKPAAGKAAEAYGRAIGLVEHLLATKQKLSQGGSEG